jgi:phage shock protein E
MARPRPAARPGGRASSRRLPPPPRRRAGLTARQWAVGGSVVAVLVVAIAVGWGLASGAGSSAAASPTGRSDGALVQAGGGHWTNITPAKLASLLTTEDVTLLNVKTPYIGEIAGTDLYIPYTDIARRAAELPADKAAKIVVYCRTGHESAIAARTLLDLGYRTIDNLDGGMEAWVASGRQLIQVSR